MARLAECLRACGAVCAGRRAEQDQVDWHTRSRVHASVPAKTQGGKIIKGITAAAGVTNIETGDGGAVQVRKRASGLHNARAAPAGCVAAAAAAARAQVLPLLTPPSPPPPRTPTPRAKRHQVVGTSESSLQLAKEMILLQLDELQPGERRRAATGSWLVLSEHIAAADGIVPCAGVRCSWVVMSSAARLFTNAVMPLLIRHTQHTHQRTRAQAPSCGSARCPTLSRLAWWWSCCQARRGWCTSASSGTAHMSCTRCRQPTRCALLAIVCVCVRVSMCVCVFGVPCAVSACLRG
jgi:hypothetical protein